MKQGLQTNFKNKDLREYGCYFFTLCAWVYLAFGKKFTDDDIIAAYEYCLKQGWVFTGIDKNGNKQVCLIQNPVQVFNYLSGKPDYFKEIYHSDFVPITKRFPVFFKRNAPNGYDHFALGQFINGKVEIIFDPWTPSALDRGLKIYNYRAFK